MNECNENYVNFGPIYMPMVLRGDENPLHILYAGCLGRYPISYIPV